MKYIVSILSIVLAGIMFITLLPASAQITTTSPWKGKLKNGQPLYENDLLKILNEHKEWLSSEGKHGKRANLSEAYLSGANLSEAHLSRAELIRTNLSMANLSGAWLDKANLSLANLSLANLGEANLSEANLSRSNS